MRHSAESRNRRKLIALIVSGVILLALVTIGTYGLLVGPGSNTEPAQPEPTPSPSVSSTPPTLGNSRPQPPRIAPTSDPETFARRIAAALFTWDTGAGLMPLDYTAAILAVGDPSGVEQAGLAADIAAYLPNRDAWLQLRAYATTQQLTIDNASVPHAWDDAVVQARPGQLPPGAVAYTIDGTRHRDGVWNGIPQVLSEPVAFTIFFACPPASDSNSEDDDSSCYLLRLSQPDNPLR